MDCCFCNTCICISENILVIQRLRNLRFLAPGNSCINENELQRIISKTNKLIAQYGNKNSCLPANYAEYFIDISLLHYWT